MNITLSNIEISSIFWLSFFLIFAFIKNKEVRNSIYSLIKSIFNFSLIAIIISIFLYVFFMTKVLEYYTLWDNSMLKDSILWALFSAVPTAFQVISDMGNFSYKELIKNLFKISAIWSVIIGAYNFKLLSMIILIPTIVIITTLDEYNKYKTQNKQIEKFLGNLLLIINLWTFSIVISSFIENWESLATTQTLKQFLLPIVYTIGICPLLFYWAVISNYQSLFASLNNKMVPSKFHEAYLKFKIILCCRFNLKKVELFRFYYQVNFVEITNTADINSFFKEFIEKSRILPFDGKNGFEVNKAIKYLEKQGLKNGLYKYLPESSNYGDYMASQFKKISSDNSIEYFTLGTQNAIKSFGLMLNLHWNNNYQEAIEDFKECIKILCKKTINHNFNTNVLNELKEGYPKEFIENKYKIILEKTIYSEYSQSIKFKLEPIDIFSENKIETTHQ